MKALTKYAALALVAGLWSCTSTKVAQQTQGEYDDLYFTSKDREQVLTASASSSSVQYDQMDRVEDASAQQNANPDYVATDNRRQKDRNADAYNANDTYYDESYADRRRFGSIRPSVAAGGVYSSPAYYDPFFSPYGYDSFHARNAYSSFYYDPFFSNRPYWGFRPGISISVSYNTWGRPWGWNAWGADPYWNAGPWGYNAWNSWGYDPFWGGGFGPGFNNFYSVNNFYGGGWNRPWGGGNTVIVGNGSNSDNNTYRNYGRRGGRGSEVISEQNNGAPSRGNAPGRGGRVDGSGDANRNPDAAAYPGYTRPRRNETPDTYGGRPSSDPSQNSSRTGSPDVITNRPAGSGTNDGFSRPTRPRSSDYNTGSSQRSSSYYNNDNSSSRPTYSAPRNDSYSGGSNSGGGNSGYSRPSRSDNGGGGYSAPAPAPSGGRSSGYSGGGSSSGGSSNGGGGSSGGYSRPPRN